MSAINSVTDSSRDGDIAILTLNSPPVNALSATVRDGLFEGFTQAIADSSVKAVVLICAGRTFIAGADISEFGGAPKGASLYDVQDLMEGAPKPVIAAIHGTALGGGLEVALVAHFRVAVPSARFGLPEVNLGLLPGAGGTQRLPRIVGPEKALDMTTSGAMIGAKEALSFGLIDEVAPENELQSAAVAFARKVVSEKRPLVKVRDNNAKVEAARGKPDIFANFRKANAKKFRGFLAPEYNVRCIEAAVNLPFDEGIKVERKLFDELMASAESAAQRYAFFAERSAQKIPDVPETTETVSVKKVGIIGAGTMGGGIAMNFSNVGIAVTIAESAQSALDRGLAVIRKNYESSAKRGRFSAEVAQKRIELIKGTLAIEDLADCDLIVEAVFESMDVKKDVFRKLDKVAKRGAILATNTSFLDINEIAAVTSRPEAVIGMHFFSPANVMRLVEVVRADRTSITAIATAMQVSKKIGKVAVLVGVCHGFVGNRMLEVRGREAFKLLEEGAMPWDIDRAEYGFGFPMGLFQMLDMAGLDVGWNKEKSKSQTVKDVLCEMDRRGQKTSAGYYDYDENRNPTPSPITEKIVKDFASRSGKVQREVSDAEILERTLYTMINEGAKILEEKKAIRASDIDTIWLNGYGWPVYRGGPMFYADAVGLSKVVAKLREWQKIDGDAYKPSALLEKLAAEGRRFQDIK